MKNHLRALFLLLAVGCATSRPLGEDEAAWPGWVLNSAGGVSIETPGDWRFVSGSSPDWSGPGIVFATGTYLIRPGGECAPTTALQDLPAQGALIWAYEFKASVGEENPDDFPPRPSPFELDPKLLANYECSGNRATYRIAFSDAGRYFIVQVALGDDTPSTIREDVVGALTSMRIQPSA